MNWIRHQHLAKRYDALDLDNPFHLESVKPKNKEFQKVQRSVRDRFQVGEGTYFDNLDLHEKLSLAEINLRTRGLVGIVLGSTVKKLYRPPRNMRGIVKEDTDIDCLILDRYSPHHPAPFEWGVDWYVRPPDGRPPTNGLVRLCYDVQLHPDVRVSAQRARHKDLPFYLDPEYMMMQYREYPENLTEKIANDTRAKLGELLPGLYLPSLNVMRRISESAMRRNKFISDRLAITREILITARQEGNISLQAFEVLMGLLNDLCRVCSRGYKLSLKDKDKLPDKMENPLFRGKILQKAEEVLDEIESTHSELRKDDYGYLVPETQDTRHCLYPVLDEDLLDFKNLIPENETV